MPRQIQLHVKMVSESKTLPSAGTVRLSLPQEKPAKDLQAHLEHIKTIELRSTFIQINR
jgi:hypothetical protein